MGVLDRFEKGIERAVNGAFAKAFRSEVQPVEIASALRRETDDKATAIARGRTLAPNIFVVELGKADHDRLDEWERAIVEELQAVVTEHILAQQYHLAGAVEINFEEADDLDTGLFRVRSSSEKTQAPFVPPAPNPAVAAAQAQAAQIRAPQAAGHYDPGYPAAAVQPLGEGVLEIAGNYYPLAGRALVIGRDVGADLVLDDTGASRLHAEVRPVPGGVQLVDLNSTNGTYVNDVRQSAVYLHDGSVITIGRSKIVFRAGPSSVIPPGHGDHRR